MQPNLSSEESTEKKIGSVLVVGGGIGGIQASLDLAASGYYVYLVEESPAIGGVMPQLDKTFPTNDCSMCILSPKLVECGRHHNIQVMTHSRVEDIQGTPGHFRVSVLREPSYVDADKCIGCGICAEKCPAKVSNAFDRGLSKRKAIYVPYPQAVPLLYTIDRPHCLYFKKGKCRLCEKFCPSKAIDFLQKQEETVIHVGAVIMAPGFNEFKVNSGRLTGNGYTSLITQYGYDKYPNVVTSVEFERILSASGPYKGHLLRPSDQQPPGRIAWIQCVGSRDVTCNSGYCSSVCCMYAVKEAVIAKEHSSVPLDVTIFFMDMRTHGKGFDKYYERAKQEYGVRFIRSKVYGIEEKEGTHNLSLRYAAENGALRTEDFDMVALSVGLKPGNNAIRLANRLGIDLNEYQFCRTHRFSPVTTSRDGVFVCGAFQGPKDIPETVMQASGAAAASAALLSEVRGQQVRKKEFLSERVVTGEPPRVGVFVCRCGVNIGDVVDVPDVVKDAASLPNVVFTDENLYACSQDTQETLKKRIAEHRLNRVVVASCSPRTHEPVFQETLQEAGLNKHLFEMANIRDQCSWVHQKEPASATRKAKDLVRMAVGKLRLAEPLKPVSLETTPAALVIGGGIAGMTSALNLAEQGFEVHLLEKAMSLGGTAKKIYTTLEGDDVQAYVKEQVEKVTNHSLVHVHLRASLEEVSGYIGNFTTRIKEGSKKEIKEIRHGAVIIATGGEEYKPGDYLYKKNRKVLSVLELEKECAKPSKKIRDCETLVIIQCVGSRDETNPYCSRVCCSESIKCALLLKDLNPEMNIYVLYRDIRTYALKEDFYRKAREKGILFIRYDPESKPEVNAAKADGKDILRVTVNEPLLEEKLVIDADLLALAIATVPPSVNKDFSRLLKIPLDEDGFFLEAHMKLRPVEFATDGIFMCGLAHGPKFIDESITQANAAASRAGCVLSKKVVELPGTVSFVDGNRCEGCGACERVCPFGAIEVDPEQKTAIVNDALCKGCGVCAASCRSNAINLHGFSNKQILEMIDSV